jgi:FKBP-type peptidyl-prolyl cis-trans isomerase
MQKLTGWLLVSAFIIASSCGKSDSSGCQPNSVDSEKQLLINFCTANNISYTVHSSGLLYQIITPGTGTVTPTTSSTVSVLYVGKFLSGTTFDSSATIYTSLLNNFIDGWKDGIPLIKSGGHIKLVIPSALAYSCAGYLPTIPANTPLYFDVNLIDVK